MKNVFQTVISQYGNSPRILQLVANINEYIDPRTDFDNFFNMVWNIDTAQGFGLDIWGRIVGVRRTLQLPVSPLWLGFDEAVPGSFPFGDEPFYNGDPPLTTTYSLSDDYYRKLILAKALSNITATNAPSLNAFLQYLFSGEGRSYVSPQGPMMMRYTFEYTLQPFEHAITTETTVFPVPCAVNTTVFNSPLPLFGFSEAGTYTAAPFGQSVYLPIGAVYALN